MVNPAVVVTVVLCWIYTVHGVTVYGVTGAVQEPQTITDASGATTTVTTAQGAWYTSLPVYNATTLQPPPIPNPLPAMQFSISPPSSAQAVNGLSIHQNGSFYGFSIEFSVVNQVIGSSSKFLYVPFLNLMSLIKERAGAVHIRVGGNTQETATLVSSLADGAMIEKDKADSTNPTETPALLFTPEILYMLNNVSSLVNIQWYLGIPFNDTTHLRLGIAEVGEAILGTNLLGFQVGNEPDLYAAHQHRAENYSQWDYFGEFGTVVQGIQNDAQIPIRNNLIAPSLSGQWSPESVWNTGFVSAYTSSLGALAVEHYPDNNCAAAFPNAGLGQPVVPQDVFANYLTHASGVGIVAPYLNSTAFAQANGKPLIMFETNSASCGGFPGVSDSFGIALWGVDYGLQMAYSNFSEALLHVGGQSDTYNPFTPPPTNMSYTSEWTIGPIFYSAMIVAEALGPTGTAQVLDLQANSGSVYTPGYAIYENGALARVALVNYITDPTGASTYTATLSVDSGVSEVYVKYLLAPSVAEKFNITWANQTLGGQLQSDGRLRGTPSITTIPCSSGSCPIPVPAPALALVFLSQTALQESGSPTTTETFPTTAETKTVNTVSVASSVLATSNGQSGSGRKLGSTSKGSSGAGRVVVGGVPTLGLFGVVVVAGLGALVGTL